MAVVRQQFAIESNAVAVHADASDEVYTLSRPLTAPAENNTIDFVARPSTRDEFFQGKLFIEANAALAVADVAVRRIEVLNLDGSSARVIVDVADNAFDLTLDITSDLLRSILLVEDESQVLVTIRNDSGGPLAGQLTARLDLGLNAGNYGSLPLNI